MSEENQNRNSRSRNNHGRSNNNNNRNRNGNGNGNRNGGGGGGNRNGGGNRGGGGNKASQQRNELQPSHGRRPKAKPLTLWQKILKAVGLYKDPAEKKKGGAGNKSQNRPAAKKTGRVAGGGRVENKGGGNKRGPRDAKKGNQRERNDRRDSNSGGTPAVETPRLYVGNLSYDAAEHDLEELFKGIGSVRNVELVYNRHTHKSKGYGFISMANVEEAERAVEVLHDQPYMGRKMIVNGARSKGPADKSDSEDRPRRNTRSNDRKPSERKSSDDGIPAEEEVHSLAPKED